jgi:hypothetical protein
MDFENWFKQEYDSAPFAIGHNQNDLKTHKKMKESFLAGYHQGYEMAERATLIVLLDQIKGVHPEYIKEIIQDMLEENTAQK